MFQRVAVIASILLACLFTGNAQAHLTSVMPMDMLFDHSAVILKATLTDLKVVCPIPDMNSFSFTATTLEVIKTDTKKLPVKMTFEVLGTIDYNLSLKYQWPYKDQAVVLFLERDDAGQLRVVNDANGIVPVYAETPAFGPVTKYTRKALYNEFKATAEKHPNPKVTAQLQSFMAALATPEDLAAFSATPDADPWIQLSSALAAARIDPQPAHMQGVIELLEKNDPLIESYLRQPMPRVFEDLWLAANCGQFGPGELMRRATAYLPIYRHILDHADADAPPQSTKQFGVGPGIQALAAVGTREDILRLWKFRYIQQDYSRYRALEGLARLLGKPTKVPNIASIDPGPPPPRLADWESETQAMLEDLMLANGLLP